MLEIKGFIKEGEAVSLTCCSSVTDVLIDDKSLYDRLDKYFNLDSETFWNDSNAKGKTVGLSFVVLDEKPVDNITYNDLVADVTLKSLYSEHITGCYSEYTCGYGGFDFFIKGQKEEEGHSLFNELISYENKWIWLMIKSERSIKIDNFLAKNI